MSLDVYQETSTKFSLGDVVWFKYHTGKVFKGTITEISGKDINDKVVTVLTEHMGYRSAMLSACKFSKKDVI